MSTSPSVLPESSEPSSPYSDEFYTPSDAQPSTPPPEFFVDQFLASPEACEAVLQKNTNQENNQEDNDDASSGESDSKRVCSKHVALLSAPQGEAKQVKSNQ